jgi:transposase
VAYDRCKSHKGSPPCSRSAGRQPRYGPHKRGLNTKLHLAVDAHGMPVRVIITAGPRADCKEAAQLIEGIDAQYLLADRGYDSNSIIEAATSLGMTAVIPPRKNRVEKRAYDEELYKLRHLVENAFLHLKRWRGIATRYAKNSASFLAAVQIRCIALWANIS